MTAPAEYRPDMLDAPPVPVSGDVDELPRRRNSFTQRWTPSTGWQDVTAPPLDEHVAAAAMHQHAHRCGAMHPNAGFYCTEDPGHNTSNGHAAKDEFGAVLRRWMGPDAYLDQDAWDAAERGGADPAPWPAPPQPTKEET